MKCNSVSNEEIDIPSQIGRIDRVETGGEPRYTEYGLAALDEKTTQRMKTHLQHSMQSGRTPMLNLNPLPQ